MRRLILVMAVVVGIVGGSLYYRYSDGRSSPSTFRTAAVKQGTMVNKVSCTGTLTAVTTVKVGCQVSGTIEELAASDGWPSLLSLKLPEPGEAEPGVDLATLGKLAQDIEQMQGSMDFMQKLLDEMRYEPVIQESLIGVE